MMPCGPCPTSMKTYLLGALSSGADFPNLSKSQAEKTVEGSFFRERVNVFVKRFSLVIYHISILHKLCMNY